MAGNAVIGAARVSLGLDSANLETGVKKARASLNSLSKINVGRGLRAGLDEAAAGFRSTAAQAGIVGTALSGMGAAGVGVGAVLVSLGLAAGAARKAMAFGDEIADTANRLAVSTKTLQEYRYAVHALGGEYNDADKSLEGFSKAFGAAQAKLSAKAVKPFTALGLDPSTFKSMEEALGAVTDKVAALSSTSEQAAIADKLGLGAMLPALRAGTAAFNAQREAAGRLGFVMDDQVLQKASQANDRMEDLEQTLKVQVSSAFVELAPDILAVTEKLVDGAKALHDYAGAVHDVFAEQKRETSEFLAWLYNLKIGELPIIDPIGVATRLLVNSAGAKVGTAPQLDPGVDGSTSAQIKNAMIYGLNGNLDPARLRQPGAGGGAARDNSASSASAIEAARRAEQNAQMQLTHNIESLADMRLLQLRAETEAANNRLLGDAAEKQITAAAAATAIGLNNQAAAAQKTAILRERDDALAQAALDQREAVGRYIEQALGFEAAMATASERARIEAAMLENQQQRETAAETLRGEQVVRDDATKKAAVAVLLATQAEAQEKERAVQAQKARVDIAAEMYDRAEAELALQIDSLNSQGDLAQSDYARAVLNLRILALEQRAARMVQQRIIDTTAAGSAEHEIALIRLASLDDIQAAQTEAAKSNARLDRALVSAAGSVADAFNSFKSNDMEGAFGALSGAMHQFAGLLGKTGSSMLGSLGTTLGTISATAGVAQSLGIGTRSGAANFALAAVGQYLGGPIGSLVALAAGDLLDGKESNHAAIATLTGDRYAISGNRRNDQTANLAGAAAQTIIDSTAALKAAGINLTTSVHAIDIGTRDAAHVILSNGQVLAAGVGDAAGAAEAALHAMLDGATYASEAQEKLVRSMLDAGTGFDKIADALDLFGQQLALPAAIADAIQQITDPKAFDLSMLTRAQGSRRQQIDDAVGAGAIGADAAAGLYEQLNRLEGLEIDQVLGRYADKTDDAADSLDGLKDAVTDAEGDLREAYNAEASAHKDNIKRLRGLAETLRGVDAQLAGRAAAARGPIAQTAIGRAELQALADNLDVNDPDAMERLQAAASAFVDATEATSPTEAALQSDIAWVRRLLGQAATLAETSANVEQSQLDALNDQVGQLIQIEKRVGEVRDAIAALNAARGAQQSGLQGVATSLGVNDNALPGFGAVSKADLDRAHAASIGVSGPAGDTAAYLIDMYRQGEFDHLVDAQGNPTGVAAQLKLAGFRDEGQIRVGGSGPLDSQLMQFMASPGEVVSITHGDPMASVGDMSRALQGLERGIQAVARYTYLTHKSLRVWDGDGMPAVRDHSIGG